MRSRQGIVELFSSFLQLEGDRFRLWVTDPALRRSIEATLRQVMQVEASENFWALYWHKLWQAQSSKPAQSRDQAQTQTAGQQRARSHLIAYVQEPCYWAAQKTSTRFSNLQYGLADCFQIAIAQVDKVLKGFDSQQGFSFKNYASATLSSLIRETLRQRQEMDICTDWALLRKLSQKRLTEALLAAGLSTETIDAYLLAWTGFKTLYIPQQATGTRKLPKPEPQTWAAIAQLYNQQRLSQGINLTASPTELEKWLLSCARAGRAYLYPTLVSIHTPRPGQESGELLDQLADLSHDSLLADFIAEEESQTRQTQQMQVGQILTAAIDQLDAQSQTLIQLYYQEGLTQQQMAERLDMKQYTVSRRLTRARETLLLALARWSQDTLHISPTVNLLNHTSAALEEWLMTHYRRSEVPNSVSIPVEQPS